VLRATGRQANRCDLAHALGRPGPARGGIACAKPPTWPNGREPRPWFSVRAGAPRQGAARGTRPLPPPACKSPTPGSQAAARLQQLARARRRLPRESNHPQISGFGTRSPPLRRLPYVVMRRFSYARLGIVYTPELNARIVRSARVFTAYHDSEKGKGRSRNTRDCASVSPTVDPDMAQKGDPQAMSADPDSSRRRRRSGARERTGRSRVNLLRGPRMRDPSIQRLRPSKKKIVLVHPRAAAPANRTVGHMSKFVETKFALLLACLWCLAGMGGCAELPRAVPLAATSLHGGPALHGRQRPRR